MTGKPRGAVQRTAHRLAATIRDLFEIHPQTRLAFTVEELADAMWVNPTATEEWLVSKLLVRARHILEDSGEHESFIPVTGHYFANYDDNNQPRNALQAKRCIAGCGRGQRSAGVRRLRVKYDGANDRLSDVWVERLKFSSTAAVRRFGGRILIAHNKHALSKERAANHLSQAAKLALPDDLASLRKLLPKGIKQDGLKITLAGKGKSLKDIARVTKSGNVK